MRVNVYSQELTSEVVRLEKQSNTGRVLARRHCMASDLTQLRERAA